MYRDISKWLTESTKYLMSVRLNTWNQYKFSSPFFLMLWGSSFVLITVELVCLSLHCIVCPSSIYGFWLALWCSWHLKMINRIYKIFNVSSAEYLKSNQKKLIISSCVHCIVCSSSIYGFWLALWCLQTFLSNFWQIYTHNVHKGA
jgi:hypothetical protein